MIEQEGGCEHDPRLVTIVNFTAIAIRRLIKMAKKINAFKNMCEEDQVTLICIVYSLQAYKVIRPQSHDKLTLLKRHFGRLKYNNISIPNL